MNMNDYQNFSKLITEVITFYEKPVTEFALKIWWNALRDKELDAIVSAIDAYVRNPDNGHFAPKPANIIKLMEGSTLDNAYIAWTKVENAIRKIGPYESVIFDDPIIHAVILDMGGWISFCEVTEKELPFFAKEFENRYQGYKLRGDKNISAPKKVFGIIESLNKNLAGKIPSPVLVGDEKKCAEVNRDGIDQENRRPRRLDEFLNSQRLSFSA